MKDIERTRKTIVESCNTNPEAIADLVMNLIARIEALEAQIHQDSHNSNLPPSSDGFKRYPKNMRVKSKRRSGGQHGRDGSTLKRTSTPDITIIHPVDECAQCGHSLKKVVSTHHHRRQVMDIPPLNMIVTEHQTEVKSCPHCGETTSAEFPHGVTKAVQYGVNLKTIGVYLMQHQLLSSKRTVEAINDLFCCPIAEGSLFHWANEVSERLEGSYKAIKEHVIASDVIHTDETGIACKSQLHWLHVACTSDATFYAPHLKRGALALNDIGILPLFKGTAVHDMWASYFKYPCAHSICNAHIIRELTFAFEEHHQRWAEDLKKLLLNIHHTVERSRAKGNQFLDVRTLRRYQQLYDTLVNKGLRKHPRLRGSPNKRGRVKQSKVRNLLDRLRDHRESVLAFMYNFEIPFTNNLAERDLRMTKVKLKISGCFRSIVGAEIYCRIRSYISTARKNAIAPFDAIANAFFGKPFILKPIYAE